MKMTLFIGLVILCCVFVLTSIVCAQPIVLQPSQNLVTEANSVKTSVTRLIFPNDPGSGGGGGGVIK